MSLASLPSGAGRKYNQKLVPKQGMELENKEITPLHQLSMSWGNCLPSCSLPLGLFMTLCKILKPRVSETPTHLLGVPNKIHLQPQVPSAISNDTISTSCRNLTTTLGLNFPNLCFPHEDGKGGIAVELSQAARLTRS